MLNEILSSSFIKNSLSHLLTPSLICEISRRNRELIEKNQFAVLLSQLPNQASLLSEIRHIFKICCFQYEFVEFLIAHILFLFEYIPNCLRTATLQIMMRFQQRYSKHHQQCNECLYAPSQIHQWSCNDVAKAFFYAPLLIFFWSVFSLCLYCFRIRLMINSSSQKSPERVAVEYLKFVK